MNVYKINVALPHPTMRAFDGGPRYMHHLRVVVDESADKAKQIFGELTAAYPTAHVTLTCWRNIGTTMLETEPTELAS